MPTRDNLIETMTQAAVTDAFHQRGMDSDKMLDFDASGQSYSFMGVNLKQCMEAAVAALEASGWTLARVPGHAADTASPAASDRGVHPEDLTTENDG